MYIIHTHVYIHTHTHTYQPQTHACQQTHSYVHVQEHHIYIYISIYIYIYPCISNTISCVQTDIFIPSRTGSQKGGRGHKRHKRERKEGHACGRRQEAVKGVYSGSITCLFLLKTQKTQKRKKGTPAADAKKRSKVCIVTQ